MILLSIITPFHNSARKCRRLLDTLSRIHDPAVELILVDDGSTDDTLQVLRQFERKTKASTHILSQENKGPGGARNYGCSVAIGQYVWFVDSDDDISVDAIAFLKDRSDEHFDFIDFDILSMGRRENTMGIEPGNYNDPEIVRELLTSKFGRICSKVIRKDIIVENRIYYPEFCLYEDNALDFIYPFFIKKFCKANIVAYIHNEEFESVTRSNPTIRYFDRLHTAVYGLSRANLMANGSEILKYQERFIILYLVNTVNQRLGRFPNHTWITLCYVMKGYRLVANEYEIMLNHFMFISGSLKYKTVFSLLWWCSYLLPDRPLYFEQMHLQAWGKPIRIVE